MRVRFGAFVLDPDTRELLHGASHVLLSPKAFELLCVLVAHRPKAMAKSDLQHRLWPGTFVLEKNLPNLIGELRAALGDDPSNPKYIRTVQRFGYAFCAPGSTPEGEARGRRPGEPLFVVKWVSGRLRLDEGTHVVGRDPDVEIFLNSPGVSRRHAMITIADGKAKLEDLESKNGTFVGEQRVEAPRWLRAGDTIRIGSVTLTLSVFEAPMSTETVVD
jgi:DNA-binding winged helix-turn-helix (wHTH) protein